MEVLLDAVLLIAAGVSLGYRFSSTAKLKTRIQDAMSPLEELDSAIRGLQQALQSEIESLTARYIQEIYASRLKAIGVRELRRYANGMRLQALKDAGIRTVADLEGWDESQVSRVPGVGQKSACAIVRSVEMATAAAKAVAIPHPSVPFSGKSERQLMEALYRHHCFGTHFSDQAAAFATTVASHQSTRDAILAETTFSRWLFELGSTPTIRWSLDQGETLIEELTDQRFKEIKEVLSHSLIDYGKLCVNPVPIESIIQDFNEARSFYDLNLRTLFKAFNDPVPDKPESQPESSCLPASDIVDADFGRFVPGPGPKTVGPTPTHSDTSVAQSQHSERLFSVSVGLASSGPARDFALPIAPGSIGTSDLRWLQKGEAIEIQGHRLAHGFIYVGKGIGDEKHFALNPQLSVKSVNLSSRDAEGHYSSYCLRRPGWRGAYLKWLADGASSATDSAFGMAYFYGIEHRLLDLLQSRVPSAQNDELDQLLQEIRRLEELFRYNSGGVTNSCSRLFEFATACLFHRISDPVLPEKWVKTCELLFLMRFGIGWFMKEGRTIPVEWAWRWVDFEFAANLRTPVLRCPEEFQAVFTSLYRQKFGDGLIVSEKRKTLKLTYQPGLPMQFGPEIRHEISGIPDFATDNPPLPSIEDLAEEAATEIDGYCRYLGRNHAKSGTFEAYLHLPLSFWPNTAAERWQQFLASMVEPIQPMSLELLLRELGNAGDPSSVKMPELVTNLNRALVGFEPDILAGARRPKPSEMVVLFPLSSESNWDRTTSEYKRASLLIALSACVALADGHLSEDGGSLVEGMISSWNHLHIDLRTRLLAQYRLQVRQGISLASLKSRFAILTSDGRMQLTNSLCSLVADGKTSAAAVRLLEQIYRALELEPKLLYTHLHRGAQQAGGQDLQKSSIPSEGSAPAVNTERLAALRRETDQVSALLAEVFADGVAPSSPEPVTISQVSPAQESSREILLPGLDAQHQRFLADLLRKEYWTREELQDMAAHSQIMLDGALERINDAAFDLFGEPVTEGDDPVYIQQKILEAGEEWL